MAHLVPSPHHGLRRTVAPVLGALALLAGLSACGEDGESGASPTAADGSAATSDADGSAGEVASGVGTALVANSPGTLTTQGDQRVLVALLGQDGEALLGGPDVTATFRFHSEEEDVTDEVEGEWVATPGSPLGMYVTHFAFPSPGPWEITLVGSDGVGSLVEVVDDSPVPGPGEDAPRSLTPTATTPEEIEAISTDPEPDPDFYELTVADAVTSGSPTVVVFATPLFCQTATCGPTLELVKEVAADHADVNVVHVEPYDIDQARNGSLRPVAVLDEWGLATEPWVFVVDGDGTIRSSFEGLVSTAELDRALTGL